MVVHCTGYINMALSSAALILVLGLYVCAAFDYRTYRQIRLDSLYMSYPSDIDQILPVLTEVYPAQQFPLYSLNQQESDTIHRLMADYTVCAGCIVTNTLDVDTCTDSIIVCEKGTVCISASHQGSDDCPLYPYRGCCSPSRTDHNCRNENTRIHATTSTLNHSSFVNRRCNLIEYVKTTCSGFLCNLDDQIMVQDLLLSMNKDRWSAWSVWSACAGTCGNVTQIRLRHCTSLNQSSLAQDCAGSFLENRSCANIPPCLVNGGWGPWGTWNCTCDTGLRERTRECNHPAPAGGGSDCVGDHYEQTSCADQCQGHWITWNTWSPCTSTCGDSTRVRIRYCLLYDNVTTAGNCPGDSIQTESCSRLACPTTTKASTTVFTTLPTTTTTEGPGVWKEWTQWSPCSTSCASGVQYRARFCVDLHTEKEKHDCSGEAVDRQSCVEQHCPVDGFWSEWNGWSGCYSGLQSRSRACSNPAPLFNGTDCQGNYLDVRNCTEAVTISTTSPHVKLVPPEIFGSTDAYVGGNITLLCLTSVPGLIVTWYYQESDRLPIGASQPVGTNELVVTGINSKNYGIYTCVLSDNYHAVKNHVIINLHESAPVIISLVTSPTNVTEGALVNIKCIVLGFPEPIIRWGYKDLSGTPYVPPPVSYKDDGKQIDISSFQNLLYGGTWICNAINKLGSDHREIIL